MAAGRKSERGAGRTLHQTGDNSVFIEKQDPVVTGGSSGIGLATAKSFVEEGAYVFIAGRRQAELDKAVAETGSTSPA